MSREKIEKLVLVGFDGLMFEMVERFTAEGRLPNMKRLIAEGCWGRMNPCLPCDTPTNWTSIATGAATGTHGINTFAAWIPGRAPLDFPYFGSRANPGGFPAHLSGDDHGDIHDYCQAEYLWQTLERAGKRCVLVNFPGGWPPNLRNGVVVDGLGIGAGVSRMGQPVVFANDAPTADGQAPLQWAEPQGWTDLPRSAAQPLACSVPLTGARPDPQYREGLYVDTTTRLHLLLTGNESGRYDTLWVCGERSAAAPLACLREGEESDWITRRLCYNAVYPVAHGLGQPKPMALDVRFRLCVRQLRPEGHVALFRGTLLPAAGWAHPDRYHLELADVLWRYEKADAVAEEKAAGSGLTAHAQLDAALHGHLADTQTAWLPGFTQRALLCAEHVLSREPWDLLFFQIHSPDGINHAHLNDLHPEAAGYDPSREAESWDRFRTEYQMLDACLGEVMTFAPKGRTLFLMVSDHACLPTSRRLNLRHALVQAGLVAYRPARLRRNSSMTYQEDECGEEFMKLDLGRSKVILGGHPLATSIWANLKGREADGVVEPGEAYEALRSQVIDLLYGLRDPNTGQCPIELALRKEDAAHLGLWGDRVGDVIFCLRPGYAMGGLCDAVGPIPSAEMDAGLFPGARLGGCHHLYLPGARFGGFSNGAVLAMSGPGVARGKRLTAPICTIDVAPTICYLLGLSPPDSCDGHAIGEGLLNE